MLGNYYAMTEQLSDAIEDGRYDLSKVDKDIAFLTRHIEEVRKEELAVFEARCHLENLLYEIMIIVQKDRLDGVEVE